MALCCRRCKSINERKQVVDIKGESIEKGLIHFHRLNIAFRRYSIVTCIRSNDDFLFHGFQLQLNLQGVQLFRPHLNVRLVWLEPARLNLKEVSSRCQIREAESAIFCCHRLLFRVHLFID